MTTGPAPTASRFLVNAACLLVIVYMLREFSDFFVPLAFAAFLATLSAPAVVWLRDHKVPTVVSVPLVVALVLSAIVGLVGFVGGSVNGFIGAMPKYRNRLDTIFQGTMSWLDQRGVRFSSKDVRDMLEPGAVVDYLGGMLSDLASLASSTVLVVLYLGFILFEATTLPAKLREAMGDSHADLSNWETVVREVKSYVVIKTLVSLATGLGVYVLLLFTGVDFPLLWGVVAFLLNYIPNIGSIIAAVPPVLLALVQFGPGRALIVLAGFVGINTLFGNIVEPALLGRRLGLSSLVVLVSLVFWGWMWGAAGMLLSVPLTMILKILFENSQQFRGVAVFMGGDPETERAPPSLPLSRRPRPPDSGA